MDTGALRWIVERMSEGVWVLAGDGRTVFVNRRASELVGRRPEELVGRTPFEVLDEKVAAVIADQLALVGTGASQAREVGIGRPDRSVTRVMVEVIPLPEEHHRAGATLITLVDVTARREAERALHEARTRFEQAFEDAPVGMALLDVAPGTSGRFLQPNRALCQMLGYSREELEGLSVQQLTHPDDLDEGEALNEHLLAGGIASYHREKRWIRKDGRVLPTLVSSSLIRDAAGRPRYGIGQVQDVTERDSAVQALRESERRLQAILEHTTAAVYVKREPDFRYELANRRAEQILGVEPGGALGRCDEELLAAAELEPVRAVDRDVLAHGHPVAVEEELWSDGEVRTFISVKVPLPADGGGPRAVCGISTEITELKRAQEERERLHAQRNQAQRLEIVGQLASGIAHDFNNLLAVIFTCLDLALAELGDHHAGEDLRDARAAAERAAGLTRQILVFSRYESVEPQVVHLDALVARMEGLLRRTLGHHLELVCDVPAELQPVLADPAQLEQVVLNLAVNARDAMPDGGRLVIAARNDGAQVVLEVIDTGSGIPAGLVSRVFDPFFTTKPPGRGTGLGLTTSHEIVKRAGGQLTVDSKAGVGTTVRAQLPAARHEGVAEPRQPRPGPGPGGQGQTVLVVEDEDAVRRLIGRILRGAGYRVLDASSSEQALAVAERESGRVDLLLSDVVMPGLPGLELAARLRGLTPTMAVLLMSGYTEDAVRLPPDVRFIAKPFAADALLASVARVLPADPRGAPRASLVA